MEPREVMPGVTMIDFRGNKDRPPSREDESDVPLGSVEALQAQIRELRHQIKHLLRSNAELEEALAAEYDEDFAQAIAENKEVILRKEVLIRELEAQLPKHLTQQPAPPPSQAPSSSGTADDLSEGLHI